MKKLLYAVIITCIGTLIIGLNTKEHNPPLPEQPTQAVVEAPQAPLPVEAVPEPIPVVEAIVEAPAPVYVAPVVYAMPEDQAKAFIYQHESGNDPGAVNSIGCRGLGQACPGSKLPCSDADYACQDEWFTGYMLARYGSWSNAQIFWQNNHWW